MKAEILSACENLFSLKVSTSNVACAPLRALASRIPKVYKNKGSEDISVGELSRLAPRTFSIESFFYKTN